MKTPLEAKRMILMDNHMGEAIPEFKIDIDRYIKDCAEISAEYVTIMARDAHGCHYYNTKFGHRHPLMEGDLLQDAIEAGKKYGIGIMAYYNTLCDHVIAAKNPDYRQVLADGTPIIGFQYYDILCMSSPYRDVVMNELKEIAENYDIKGLFLDITYIWEGACHCEYCKKDYKEMYGVDMPDKTNLGSIECKREYEFKRTIRKNFLRDAARAVKSVRKDIAITWNRSAHIHRAEYKADLFADFLTSEMHPPSYFEPSLKCRWNRCRNKPFDLTIPYELGSWGDWTVAPTATLKSLAAVASSLGCSCTFGTDLYPSGKYAGRHSKSMLSVIGECFNWMKKREPWREGVQKLPAAAIIFEIQNMYNDEYHYEFPESQRTVDLVMAAGKMLQECGIDYDVLDESTIPSDLSAYEFIVLPDQSYISKRTENIIREYVRTGGKLIASGTSSLYNIDGTRKENYALSDVFGVTFEQTSPYSITYIDEYGKISKGNPDVPILVKRAIHQAIRCMANDETEVLAMQTDPAFEHKPYRHVYHQHAHPALETIYPAITCHQYGKGKCIYISVSLESSFAATGSPWLRNIYRNCIHYINPKPKLIVEGDSSIDVSLYKQVDQLVLNLICIARSRGDGGLEYIENEPIATNVKVRIMTDAKRVYLAPDLEKVDFEFDGEGYLSFTLPMISTGAVIVFE